MEEATKNQYVDSLLKGQNKELVIPLTIAQEGNIKILLSVFCCPDSHPQQSPFSVGVL